MTALLYDVAYADTDAGGIVYHAAYLAMAERSRNRALATLGIPVAEMKARLGVLFIMRDVRAVYHRPAVLGDVLALSSGIVALTAARVLWRTTISRETVGGGEGPLCDVEAELAAFDPAARAPCPVPAALAALLDRAPRLPPVRRRPMMRSEV